MTSCMSCGWSRFAWGMSLLRGIQRTLNGKALDVAMHQLTRCYGVW